MCFDGTIPRERPDPHELRRNVGVGTDHHRAHPGGSARRATADQQHPVGHELRQRLRAAGGRPRARVQDVGHLQPRVRRAGVRVGRGLLRPARAARAGRSRSRSSSRCSSSRRCSGSCSTASCSATSGPRRRSRRLVTTLALLVAIPQILKLWFGQNPQYGTQGIVPNGDHAYNPFGTVFVSRDDLATIGITVVAVVALDVAVPLHRARVAHAGGRREPAHDRAGGHRRRPGEHGVVDALQHARRPRGRAPRAAVRSGVGAQLHDARGRRDVGGGARRSLTSIPVAFVGGLVLGVDRRGPRRVPARRTASSRATCGRRCRSSCCSCVLIFSPVVCATGGLADPLAGVDPPPPPLARDPQRPRLTNGDPHLRSARSRSASATTSSSTPATNWVDVAIRAGDPRRSSSSRSP